MIITSYLLISDLIKSGEQALSNDNQWCALSMALMLPSICSRLEYEKDSSYYEIKKKRKRWYDKKAYISWCTKYLFRNGWLVSLLGKDGPEILYMLRCDMVHAGYADVFYNQQSIYLSTSNNTTTILTSRLIVNIKDLCDCVFGATKNWCENYGADRFHYTFVFDENNHDDTLLYNDLRDKERLSVLRNEFALYEQKRHDAKQLS